MIIFIDHDGTYSEDPFLWNRFIKMAVERDHEVHMVTLRHEYEPISDPPCLVHYTGRKAKADFMEAKGFPSHGIVWVDDMPWFLYNNAEG